MKYYIQVKDGVPEGFIISEENLMEMAMSPNQLIGHPVFYEVIFSDMPKVADDEVIDGGAIYSVEGTSVLQKWNVRKKTSQEIAQREEEKKKSAVNLIDVFLVDVNNALSIANLSDEKRLFLESHKQSLLDLKKSLPTIDQVLSMKMDVQQFLTQ